jgi:filamentous hemagglutinin family protein
MHSVNRFVFVTDVPPLNLYGESTSRPSLFKRLVLWLTLTAFVLQPLAVTAQVVSATTGSKGPEVGTAQNGVPVVQIRAPSAAGVSHNQYDIYSPTAQGVVLNNSPVVVQSQLAGFIEGNAQLAGGPARLILNEVVGALPSELRGYSEVAGPAAELIIANPNGITCNGCGFINTTRGVLTTGTPLFGAGGSLDAWRVSGGHIHLNGAGLNGSPTAQIDLIARAVKINAEFWGQKLNVIAGANQVKHGDLSTQTITGTTPAPAVAIDVAALGGMYAHSIRLVGTEAGVGVVSDGTLAAQAGDMTIDSAGYLTVNGATQARGRIDLHAQQDLTHTGTLYAQGDAQLVSQAQLRNHGTVTAEGDLTLDAAGALDNRDGTLQSTGALSLRTSEHYTHSADSTLRGDRALRLASGGDLTLAADLSTPGQLTLVAGGTLRNHARQDGHDVDLRAAHLDNNGLIAADNDLTARVEGQLINRSNKLILAGRDQRLYVDELLNEEDGTLYAGRELVIQKDAAGAPARQVSNQIGRIEAGNDLIIRSDVLRNQGRTPTLLTRTTHDAIPGVLTACPGPNPSSPQGGCVNSGQVNAAGETIWYSHWGFRVSTPSEVEAYFARHPEAPTGDPYAPSFLGLLTANRSDWHERETGWEVGLTRSEQYLAPDAVIKGGQLLAGRDLVFAGGRLDNVGSLIDAHRDVSLSGDTLTNQGQSLQTTTTYHSARYTLSDGRHQLDGPYYTRTAIQTTGAVPSSITAGGTLRGNLAAGLANDNRARPATVAPEGPAHIDTGPLLVPAASRLGLTRAAPSTAPYLIETNPRYANRGHFISSDYFLARLGLDPQVVEKRLGDAAWEQARVRDQLFALTGRRFLTDAPKEVPLGDGRDEMAQYQRLMDNAYAARQAFDFKIGVALTAEQIAQLTSDIVWLVEHEAVLADGRRQKVLVPQVYLSRLTRDDLAPDGALIAAHEIELVAPDLANRGRLRAGQRIDLIARDLANSGSIESTQSEGIANLTAVNDLSNIGGTIAGRTVALTAGRDLINRADSFKRIATLAGGAQVVETQLGAAGRIVAGDQATLVAGQDLRFEGGQLASVGDTTLQATRNLSLGTATQQTDYTYQGHGGRSASSRSAQRGSTLDSSGRLALSAGQDIEVIGSASTASTTLTAQAGKNLTIGASQDRDSAVADLALGCGGSYHALDRETLNGSTLSAGQAVTLSAGQDATISASTVSSTTGTLDVAAGRDLSIRTQNQHREAQSSVWGASRGLIGSRSHRSDDQVTSDTAVSSQLSGTQITLRSGRDTTVSGSQVSASGDLEVAARRQLTVESAQEHRQETHARTERTNGFAHSLMQGTQVGTRTQMQQTTSHSVTQVDSTLSGAHITTTSGGDTTVRASNLLADQDITVLAGGKVDLLSAAHTQSIQSQQQNKASTHSFGDSLTGRTTIYGQTREREDSTAQMVEQRSSLLSANQGNLTVRAGVYGFERTAPSPESGTLTTQGADLLAGQQIALSGTAVDLQAIADTQENRRLAESHGLTIGAAPAGVMGQRIAAISDTAQQARNTDNKRLQAAAALKAGYDAYKLYAGANATQTAPPGAASNAPSGSGAAFGVSVSVNSSRGRQDSESRQSQVRGTNAQAKSIAIEATEGDVQMAAAKLQAQALRLDAAEDIRLLAAANTAQLQDSHTANSLGAGVTVGAGDQSGISFQLSASQAKGLSRGNETVWDNTQLTATDTLSLRSGSDTTLKGAQVAARSVAFDVGKDLLIETLQDASGYDSKQSHSGFNLSLCVPPICAGVPVTGNITLGHQTIDHNYLSAVGQSGIAAGDGGFDLTVSGKTELVGAAITGSADPATNRLRTASLTSRDLQNAQQTEAESSSLSLAYGGSAVATLAQNVASNALGHLAGQAGLPQEGSEAGTTQSVISPASITITGSGDAAQDEASRATADLLTKRDPATANGALKNTLTLQQAQALQAELKTRQENQLAAQYVGAVVSNVIGDVAKSQNKTLQAQENARAKAADEAPKTVTAWTDGSPEKIALHGLAGLIQAQVGGSSAAAGVTAGMTHEALVPLMDAFLRAQGFSDSTQASKKEFDALMNAGSVLLGAAVGAAASGKVQGASSGASVALMADVNNRQLHPDERKFIDQKSRELAAQTCKGDTQCLSVAQRYWNDQLTAEAEASDDSTLAQQRSNYLNQIAATGMIPGAEGQTSGEAARYLQNAQIARNALNELKGQAILGTDGKPILADGAPLTFFSGSQVQRADHDLYAVRPGLYDSRVSANGSASTVVSSQELIARGQRDAARVSSLSVANGRLENNTTDLDLATLGTASLIKSGVKSLAGAVGGLLERKAAQAEVEGLVRLKGADTLVANEIAALNRIKANPNGPTLNGKAPNTVLNQQLIRALDLGNFPGAKEVATIIEPKITQQLGTRGWSVEAIESVISSPAKTVVTRDTRFDPAVGTRLNDPATGYISHDGAYIVRNDRTGQVVQISNKNDPTWKAPWDN